MSIEDAVPKHSTPMDDLLRSLERAEFSLSSDPKLNLNVAAAKAFKAEDKSDCRVSNFLLLSLYLVLRSEIVPTYCAAIFFDSSAAYAWPSTP